MNGYLVTAFGIVLIGLGSWISFYGQVLLRKADAVKAQKEKERDSLAIAEKLQSVLGALGAAKQQESKKLTEEKIGIIQSDLVQWANEFAQSQPARQKEIDAARLTSTQKEIQLSDQARPIIAFALRFIEESVRAYANKTGRDIKITIPELPLNFYSPEARQQRRILEVGNASWDAFVEAQRPLNEENPPHLYIIFQEKGGTSGTFLMTPFFHTNKLNIQAWGTLPLPDYSNMTGETDLARYEDTIRLWFRRLIEAQVLSEFSSDHPK